MTKVYLKTYGCQMNEYDSSRMLDLLYDAHGITPTDDPQQAKILMLNTCSIREKAHEKVFSELGRWRALKLQDPAIIIGVTGCVGSQEGGAIQKRAPYVDFVLGPQTIHKLPEILTKLKTNRTPIVDVSFPKIEKFDNLPEPSVNGPSALVSIIEGCNKSCSYCIVPFTRGKEASRPLADVLQEITILSQKQVVEVTLLGQNVNAYRGAMAGGKIADLAMLIKEIAAIENIKRIRFTTSHPNQFADNLILAFKDVDKLANHLHLPVQSGSDRILHLMKRGYTTEIFKNKIERLRAIRPDITISTDIIVGFPGETEADFAATLDLVQEVGMDHSYCFIYSKRPGTAATDYPDDVSADTKKQRLHTLQNLLQEQVRKISQSMVGTTQHVLVTKLGQPMHGTACVGKTENNRNVFFPNNNLHIGQIVPVHISKAITHNLYGELQQ